MINEETQTIRIDDPLYNSRIIKMYVEYLQIYHPQVNVNSLLQSTWINSYELEDQGHWFSQWQVDRFHDLLNKETGRYVYRIVALKLILSNPQNYGFRFKKKDLYPEIQTYRFRRLALFAYQSL